MINLYRTNSMWRPLSLIYKKKEYELGNIIFFNENGIITEVGFGYFDDDKERNFEGSVVRKLKADFKMKDNFIVKSPKDYSYETRYDLYVYEGNVDIKFLITNLLSFDTFTSKITLVIYSMILCAVCFGKET